MSANTLHKQIDALLDSEIPFALFRLPGEMEPHMVIGRSEGVTELSDILDISQHEGFVIAPFVVSKETPIVIIHPEDHLIGWDSIERALNALSLETCGKDKKKTKIEGTSFEEYSRSFNLFHQALEKKRFNKLVLARTAKVDRDNSHSIGEIYMEACNRYSEAFVWLAKSEATGIWFGATPETLIEGNMSKMKTIALAGTERIESNGAHRDWSASRYLEQEIVSEYIRVTLRGVTDSFDELGPTTVTAGKVAHLKTTFNFMLSNGCTIGELLKNLHPTPAVCGIPKDEAINFIKENESINRRYYSGYAGYISKNLCSNLFVNLRSMEILPNSLILYAGGGILSSSDVDSEWLETEDKLQTILSLLI